MIDTGDRVEGAGLYDASHPKGTFTYPIIAQQLIDVVTCGNHELYQAHTAEREYLVTVPSFKGNYLASNIDIISPLTGERVPLAPRFRKLTTKNTGLRVLAFGFLFDFVGNANNTFVQAVAETVKEEWFLDAIHDRDLDLILVAGHVALRSEEYSTIFEAIRKANSVITIALFGGHTHIRDSKKFDERAFALESGRYMETVGFMSIGQLVTGAGRPDNRELALTQSQWPVAFRRRYIDANLYSYHNHTGLNPDTFPTDKGRRVSAYIARARTTLDLDHLYGCAPHDYFVNRAEYPGGGSVFTLLEKQILPDMIARHQASMEKHQLRHQHDSNTKMIITNTGAVRFDIFRGPLTKDSLFTISPFTSGFGLIRDVPMQKAKLLLPLLNNAGQVLSTLGRSACEMGPPQQAMTQQWTSRVEPPERRSSHQPGDQAPLSSEPLQPQPQPQAQPKLTPGYTTDDDLGDGGDDTVHSKIAFYRVPNCIQSIVDFKGRKAEAPTETVDLVFNEFLTPWLLMALEFVGLEYTQDDVRSWGEGQTLTTVIQAWVEENWDKNC